MFSVIKRLVPRAIKQEIRNTLQDKQLSSALAGIKQLSPEKVPPPELLLKLETGWNNEGMSARPEYLQAVARYAMQTPGPILECGSGLTTLILAVIASRRDVEVWTLESSADWHRRMTTTLERHKIETVNNCLAELKDYDDFAWYDAPLETLPSTFGLIICDGPPGTTKGGRYGLVPVLNSRFANGTIILLDDADRPEEQEAIRRWSELINLEVSFHDQARGKFAVINIQESRE